MIFRSPYPDVEIPEISVPEYILERTKPFADRPALIDGLSGRTYTYGQMAAAIRMLAGNLAARGLKKGDVFAIYSPNLPEYAIAFHGVALAGGILTTLNPLYTVREVALQLKDSGAKYLLTIPQFLDKAQAAADQVGIEEVFVIGEATGAPPFAAPK